MNAIQSWFIQVTSQPQVHSVLKAIYTFLLPPFLQPRQRGAHLLPIFAMHNIERVLQSYIWFLVMGVIIYTLSVRRAGRDKRFSYALLHREPDKKFSLRGTFDYLLPKSMYGQSVGEGRPDVLAVLDSAELLRPAQRDDRRRSGTGLVAAQARALAAVSARQRDHICPAGHPGAAGARLRSLPVALAGSRVGLLLGVSQGTPFGRGAAPLLHPHASGRHVHPQRLYRPGRWTHRPVRSSTHSA